MLRPHRKSIHIPEKSAKKHKSSQLKNTKENKPQQQQHKSLRKTKPKFTKENCQNFKHRTGSLVSCCQLLAKLLDSPQQPASFPLPVQSSRACHGRLRLSLFGVVCACAHLCACFSERVFLVCEKAVFYCSLCCSHACFALMEIQR
jgi:hypothetical protein